LLEVLLQEKPDWTLVYGDTNSTLAGALAAAKLHIPVAHVEAGLRSRNRQMPEEINRVLTDHVSEQLFCPTETAVSNLRAEGIVGGVHCVGDVMYDALLENLSLAQTASSVLGRLNLRPQQYFLATVHRAENTDDPARLTGILEGLCQLNDTHPVVWPMHPRARRALESSSLLSLERCPVRVIEPAPYLDMLLLERHARCILTDSGGVQKEAYWLGVPCVTLRDETEWVETVQAGWNVVAGAVANRIVESTLGFSPPEVRPPVFGDGKASQRIATTLAEQS